MGYRLGMFENPTAHKTPIRCRRCGKAPLYWHEARLHHWACPTDGAKPQFALHRCGFDSRGTPTNGVQTDDR